MISALILEEIMWTNRLKRGLLCKNKIITTFLLVFYTSKRYLLKKYASYIQNNSITDCQYERKILIKKHKEKNSKHLEIINTY